MTTASMPQSPAFAAACQAYFDAHARGIRDMDILGPLVDRAFTIFNWTPRPPVKPLSKRAVNATVKKWMALPKEQGDRLERVFTEIRDMPEEESTKLLDFWLAVMDVMRDARQQATYTAPLGG